MRTTLILDDSDLKEVIHISGKSTRSEAVRFALKDYLANQKKKKLLALRGKVDIKDNWESLRKLDTAKEAFDQ